MAGVKSGCKRTQVKSLNLTHTMDKGLTKGEPWFYAHGTSISVWNFKQEEIIFKLHSFRNSHMVLATKAVEVRSVERSRRGKGLLWLTCKDGPLHGTGNRGLDQEARMPGWGRQDPGGNRGGSFVPFP